MYASFPFIMLGFSVLADSLLLGAVLAMVPVYFQFYVIPAEEELMLRLFGQQYADYCVRVPRWWF
jgi:protein-S-isoprenylcysteine O-methyltransferase Ste14